MRQPKYLAITPSVDPERADELAVLAEGFASIGVSYLVVCNSDALEDRLSQRPVVPYVASGGNRGFGWAIHQGVLLAPVSDWDWLILINDDALVDPKQLESALPSIDGNRLEIHYFDPEPVRRIPTPAEVLLNLSMLANVVRALEKRAVENHEERMADGTYKSFSAVAISRQLWNTLDGFDSRLPFTYEDAEFASRAWKLGANVYAHKQSGVDHKHSASSTRGVADVLPVSVWSAYQYLVILGLPQPFAKAMCAGALMIRSGMVWFASARKPDHLRGIFRSIRSLVRNLEPELPRSWGDDSRQSPP